MSYSMVDHGTHWSFENGTLHHDFKQLFNYYPSLKPLFPFEWENKFNGYTWAEYATNTIHQPFIASAVYLVFCFGVQALMKNRQPFGLKRSLAAWNLLLATFSFFGAVRTVPHLLNNLFVEGFHYTVCNQAPESYGFGASGLWTGLFIYSKLPELGDTVFIVLRKKPLIFLHWYHHITVLLFCWHAFATQSSAGLYFVAMNYSVHAIMYFYYFLMAVNAKPAWINPLFITMMQLSQMAVGIFVCGATYYYKVHLGEEDKCHVRGDNLFWCAAMYASYFALFLEFLLKRYVFKAHPKAKPVTANGEAKKAKKVE
eukprot:comp11927_c0_seq1/m.6592 comp11927_c0_seq1/g.6592  ORF comp11927_c0_seq1/g.6592 comp11927_c0_seq1/m.6592 type:complete len:313 (-) comp11927_c0_seq1:488-1426(-)